MEERKIVAVTSLVRFAERYSYYTSYYMSAIVGGIPLQICFWERILGSVLMLLGFFIYSLYLGFSFICISIRLIKSNIATFIDRSCNRLSPDNLRRDFGFNIFYMIINLGAFLVLFYLCLKVV